MKKSVKRFLLASLLACALAVTSIGFLSFGVASAEVATDETKITMLNAASLRLEQEVDETNIPFGLRFKTQVNKEWYDTLQNPHVYTLLLPTDLLVEEELSEGTEKIVKVENEASKKYEVGENYVFNTVLTDIPDTAYGREISARSYIVADDQQTPIYSPLETDKLASVSRSVVNVADEALQQDAESYGAVDKYLIAGATVSDNRYVALNSTSKVDAAILYREGTSDAVKAILNSKYAFTYSSSDEGVVKVLQDGTLQPITAGTAQITVENSELNFNKTISVTAYEPSTPVYGTLSYDNLDIVDDVKTYSGASNLQRVEDSSETMVSFYYDRHASGNGKQYAGFTVEMPEWIELFDTMTVTVKTSEDTTTVTSSNSWRFFEYTSVGGALLSYNGDSVTFTGANQTVTYTVDLAATPQRWKQTNGLAFYVRSTDDVGQTATFLVGAPTFGIKDITAKGTESVDLYAKFHTEEGKASFTFTPTGSDSPSSVSNPAAFTATQDGVITATIQMDDYEDGTVTANYRYTKLLQYGEVIDFTNIDESLLIKDQFYNKDYADECVSVVNLDNGRQAIEFAIDGTTNKQNTIWSGGVGVKLPDYYENFTGFSVTFKIIEEIGQTATANWFLFINNSNTYGVMKDPGNSDTATYTGDYLPKVGLVSKDKGTIKLNVKLSSSHEANVQSAKFYITDFRLAYANEKVSEASEKFSWDTYGLDVSELSDVSFEKTAISTAELSSWKPTQAGTLTFTVTKEGFAPTPLSIKFDV